MTAPDYIQYIQVEHFDSEDWDLLDLLPLADILQKTGLSVEQFFDLASRGLVNYVYLNGAVLVREEAIERFRLWLEGLVTRTNLCRCSITVENTGQISEMN